MVLLGGGPMRVPAQNVASPAEVSEPTPPAAFLEQKNAGLAAPRSCDYSSPCSIFS